MKTLTFQKYNRLNVYDNGYSDIILGQTGIYCCFPAIDGQPAQAKNIKISSRANQITAIYSTAKLHLELAFAAQNGHIGVQISITNPRNCNQIESVSLFDRAYLAGYEKVLALGYFSWDRSALIPTS